MLKLLTALLLLLPSHYSRVQLCVTYTAAHQAPLSLGFSRQEYWSELPFPWITANWKILKEMGIQDHLICLLRNLYVVKKQQLEPSMK